MSEQRCSFLGPVFIIGAICVLGILVSPPLLARAALPSPQRRPPTATPVLPTRPATATPAYPVRPATVTPTRQPSRSSADCGAIELSIQFLPGSPSDAKWRQELWTMVEWQDGLGNWHAIDGWNASLDEVKGNEGKKVWYVSNDQFGKGPFRWLICAGPNSDPMAESLPFHMPNDAGVIVQANVSVGQPVAASPTSAAPKSAMPVSGGEQRFLGLQVLLSVCLIGLLVAPMLSRDSSRRID